MVEIKNCAKLDLAGWVQEAQVEAVNDNALAGIVAVVWPLKVRVRAWSVISMKPLSVAKVLMAVAPPPEARVWLPCLVSTG